MPEDNPNKTLYYAIRNEDGTYGPIKEVKGTVTIDGDPLCTGESFGAELLKASHGSIEMHLPWWWKYRHPGPVMAFCKAMGIRQRPIVALKQRGKHGKSHRGVL